MTTTHVSIRVGRHGPTHFAAVALLVWTSFALATVRAAPSDAGSIAGSINSTGTGNMLQGAVVSVPALNRTEMTDNSGAFLLANLPSGEVSIVVSYTGFDDARQTVVVRPGQVTHIDLALRPTPAITMEAFTVSSEREGDALAVTEQRNAENIKTVTAMDSWGNMPNMSVAEVAMRLPGMTFELDSDGVAMNVMIRGMSSDFTRLSIDGLSTTSVAGNGRTASLHSFSGAMYEQVEIISGQLPERSADSIGGALNLKTRSTFGMREKRRVTYSAGARWAPPFFYRTPERAKRDFHPTLSFSYAERYSVLGGSNNLGIALSLAYSEYLNLFNIRTFDYQTTTNPVAYLRDYQTLSGTNNRHYSALTLKTDYKYSPTTKFSLSFLFNRGTEPTFDRNLIQASGNASIAALGADGRPTGNGAVLPGFTEHRTEIRPVSGSNFDISQAHWSFYSHNPTLTFTGDHRWSRLSLDYAARYSYTHFDSGTGKTGKGKGSGGQVTMRVPGIGFILDKADPDGRVFTQTAGPSVYDLSNYTSNIVLTKRDSISDVPEVSANANLAYSLPTEPASTLKTGLSFRRRGWETHQRDPRRWNRVAGAPPLPAVFTPLSTFDLRQGGPRIPAVDVRVLNAELDDPSLWTEDLVYRAQQKYVSNRNANEEIRAAYVQAQTKVNRVSILGGVRMEDTEVEGYTWLRFRTTPAAVEPDPFKRMAMDYNDVSNKGRYRRSFPSLHGTYQVTPNLKARLSWSTAFGRPNFVNLVPSASVNEGNQTITGSNPGLGPQRAKKTEAKLEYFFKPAGLLSAVWFNKRISDYIVTQEVGIVPFGPDNGYEGNYEGYRFFTSVNAGSAEVTGWEFSWQQQFTFLPGLLRGLSLNANYTRLETQGNFGGTYRRTGQIPGFTPRSANGSLMYTYRKFSTRITRSWTGQIITSYSANEASRIYRRPLTVTNVNLSYRWRPYATFFCDVNNVTETGPYLYRFIPERVRDIRYMPSAVTFGVNGTF